MPGRERPPASARHTALRLLARREHSARELQRKLARRGHGASDTADLVQDLAARDLQSDVRFAEDLVRSRIAHGYGPQRITHELQMAGVSSSQAQAALDDAAPDWPQLTRAAHARRFRAPPADATEWQKQYRFLASRGFEPEQIYAVLKLPFEGD